jgi:hypothetical protein
MQEMRPFLDDLRQGNFRRALTENRVFKSIFRTGYPSTPRNQALIIQQRLSAPAPGADPT